MDSSIATLPLLWEERRVLWLRLDGANVAFEWNDQRRNTWTFGTGGGEPLELPRIRRADITDTTVSYSDPLMRLFTDPKISDIAATGTRIHDAIAFNVRSEGRRGGKECVSPGRSRWSPYT